MKLKRIKSTGIAASLLAAILGGVILTANITEGTLIRSDYEPLAEKRHTTVLVYMIGSDLESGGKAATLDLLEMQDALAALGEAADDLNLVIEAGGTEIWHTQDISRNTRFTMTANGVTNPVPISARNMGHSNSLTDFISYGVRSYPASQYVLLFWNHGGGAVYGFGQDELYKSDSVTLSELRQAFSHKAVNDFSFELIGFDACLMSTAETASALAPWGRYMVASQELEPADGWNYSWLTALPAFDGLEIGRTIAEWYVTEGKIAKTLSIIDLSYIPALNRQITSSFAGLANDDGYERLSKARASVQGFGMPAKGGTPDILDLSGLAEAVNCDELYELKQAVEKAVPLTLSNSAAGKCGGLTVYLPSGSDAYFAENIKTYMRCGFAEGYILLVEGYTNFLQKQNGIDLSGTEVRQDGSYCIADIDEIDSAAGVYLTLFQPFRDGWYSFLGVDSDVTVNPNGRVSAQMDGLWLSLEGQPLCSLERLCTEDRLESVSPVLYNSELAWLSLYFDWKNPDGAIEGVILNVTGLPSRLLALSPGDTIVPLYPLESFSENGIPAPIGSDVFDGSYAMGEKVVVPEMGGLWLERLDISTEGLLYGFAVADLAQKWEFTDFTEYLR